MVLDVSPPALRSLTVLATPVDFRHMGPLADIFRVGGMTVDSVLGSDGNVPPSVVVRAQFPGANPKVLAETVAAPLEESINGVENMLYMQSQANSDGNLVVTVNFHLGVDPDKAQQLVQNRVTQALPRLPEEVQRLGVTTMKSSPTLTMVVHLTSPDARYDVTYLSNYAVLNVKDVLARVPGVGQVLTWGAGDYAMRVWLDPDKVAARSLTRSGFDVVEVAQGLDQAVALRGAGRVAQSHGDRKSTRLNSSHRC